jgi:hypothetical protein
MDSVNNSSLPKNLNNINIHTIHKSFEVTEVNQIIIPSILNKFEETYIEEYSPLNIMLYTSSIPENQINHSYDLIFFIFLILYIKHYIKHYHTQKINTPFHLKKIQLPPTVDFVKCFISVVVLIFTKNVENVF